MQPGRPTVNSVPLTVFLYKRRPQAMIRFFFRFLGLLLLAAAFILVIYDGTKSIAANNLYFTSMRSAWELVNAGSLAAVRPLISPYAGGVLWDPGMVVFLAAPAWSVLGFLGVVFMLLGRRKKPLIGYARS
ncbi:hypothetical protein DW352_17400 [Pseudolabrys taiwanensis]|uniref:PetM family of cytochrome b6f complex subunit 7 n=2 Tax=Pseudolabrys taiwanensis TaxID=331696 RepID=A0A345ZYZ9_9HYPH|nr:hypothetical protein DW352_17400 [Pseudolabrys taiwanensis]